MNKPFNLAVGIDAFMEFIRGMLNFPVLWYLFLVPMVVVNAVVPLFLLQHLEALLVLGTFLVSFGLMVYLTGRFGFTRILGLGHIVWIPMLAFLLPTLVEVSANDLFGIWIRTLLVINGISLVIDTVDVARYIAGERQETFPGLSSAPAKIEGKPK